MVMQVGHLLLTVLRLLAARVVMQQLLVDQLPLLSRVRLVDRVLTLEIIQVLLLLRQQMGKRQVQSIAMGYTMVAQQLHRCALTPLL
jgi:hypothetical protein